MYVLCSRYYVGFDHTLEECYGANYFRVLNIILRSLVLASGLCQLVWLALILIFLVQLRKKWLYGDMLSYLVMFCDVVYIIFCAVLLLYAELTMM